MADGNEDLEETSFKNKSGKNQQETESFEATNVKTNSRDAVDCIKEPINQDSDDLKAENTQNNTSFKVPSTVQKDTNPSKPVTAEKKEKVPELKYKEPWWSARPQTEENFNLEVLKNGCIISTLNLNEKAYHVFGRLPSCDVVLEHPSISRHHALVQYRGETDGDKTLSGFYLYDLGSTHGTIVNKSKIKAKTYYRLKVGYVIKFGGSSRLFILQGPQDDEEDESEAWPSETTTGNETKVKVGQIFTDEEYDSLKKVENKKEENEGIDWGFGEDAEEEQIDSEKFQELYSGVEFKDPKKTLRGYYEREGLDLEYQVDETGPGHARVYHCRVRLPVDGPNGSAVYAEASVAGRKKDAVHECANEACKMLDAYGLLRQSSHESRKKRERNLEEDDFYESDEDNFLDRTGTIEKKRLKRMRKAGKEKSEVETYHSLSSKLEKVQEEIQVLVKRIQDAEALEETDDGDSLDDFMNTMSQRLDKQTKIKLKRNIAELKKDEERIRKLVALTKPADLPTLQSTATTTDTPGATHERPDEKTTTIKEEDSSTSKNENKECFKEPSTQSREKKTTTDDQTSTTTIPVEKTHKKAETFKDFAVPVSTVKNPKASKISKPPPVSEKGKNEVEKKKVVEEPLKITTDKTPLEHGEIVQKPCGKNEKGKNIPKDTLVSQPVAKKQKRHTAPTQWEDANDPDYASWIPPEDQSGDGKTKLNEKYGY